MLVFFWGDFDEKKQKVISGLIELVQGIWDFSCLDLQWWFFRWFLLMGLAPTWRIIHIQPLSVGESSQKKRWMGGSDWPRLLVTWLVSGWFTFRFANTMGYSVNCYVNGLVNSLVKCLVTIANITGYSMIQPGFQRVVMIQQQFNGKSVLKLQPWLVNVGDLWSTTHVGFRESFFHRSVNWDRHFR